MEYIFDFSDLLPYEEWEELEARARDITNGQHCGVYFVLIRRLYGLRRRRV